MAFVLIAGPGCDACRGRPVRAALGEPDPIALVDGVVISRPAYLAALALEAPDLAALAPARRAFVRRAVLDRLIDEALLRAEVARAGIAHDGSALAATLAAQRTRFRDEGAFAAHLRGRGETPETHRARVALDVAVAALLVRRGGGQVDEAEARRRFERKRAVFARPDGTIPTFEEARSAVEAALREEALLGARRALLSRLRAAARVEVRDPSLR